MERYVIAAHLKLQNKVLSLPCYVDKIRALETVFEKVFILW